MNKYTLKEKTAVALMKECDSLSFGTRLSELDCSKSWSRYDSKRTFDQILKIAKASKHVHYFFLEKEDYLSNDIYLDIGLKVKEPKTDIGLFIFMRVPIMHLDYLVKKYKIGVERY